MNTSPSSTRRRRASFRALAFSALGFGVWWVVSVVVHAVFFGAMFVATPPAETAPADASELTMRISPDRVREVVAEIREEESPRFKERLEELLKIKADLDRLNAEKIAQYNEIVRDEGPRVLEKLPDASTRVIAAQKEALAAQATAQAALDTFASSQADAALQSALAAQDAAMAAQRRAAAAQDEVAAQLRLTALSPQALAAHQAATGAQGEAVTAQGSATGPLRALDPARRALQSAEEAAARQQAVLAQANERVIAAQSTLAARQETLGTVRQRVEAAGTEAAAATTAAGEAAATEKKRLAELARQAAAQLKKEQAALTKAEQDVRQAQINATRQEEGVVRQKQRTDEALAAEATRRQAVAGALAAVLNDGVKRQQTSTAAQQSSLALQQAANAAITKAIAALPADAAPAAAQASVLSVAEEPARTLEDLYRQAQAAEVAVAETFRHVRAAELASIRKIPLADALAMTKVATPDRPVLDTAILTRDIASVKGVREQEKTIGAASDQMDSMVALARRMRELAADTGAHLSVADIQAQSTRNERMEQLATEDAGAKAKDLSGEMAAAHGTQGGVHGVEGGDGQGAAAGGAGRAAREGYGTPGGGPDITTIAVKNYKPLHGRTVRAGRVAVEPGRNPEWLYVDTWHLIGPWPNPGRKNLNTKFPPETVVNLDATYQGGRKNEVPLPVSWEYFQMPSKVTGKDRTPAVPMIMPPGMGDYEIYYGYTELWFDEPADLWVAIGSDDQSKVWINDLLIWKSGDAHKSWVANEGLRKVHFRKGINRVLYRLENGQNSGGFSFIVCLAAD